MLHSLAAALLIASTCLVDKRNVVIQFILTCVKWDTTMDQAQSLLRENPRTHRRIKQREVIGIATAAF
jgi:hypothetical protein